MSFFCAVHEPRAILAHAARSVAAATAHWQVQWELKRPDGKFDVDGKLYDKLQLTTIVDGYTAPITSGNFVRPQGSKPEAPLTCRCLADGFSGLIARLMPLRDCC